MIEIEGLGKRFGATRVLNDVSFTAGEGEVIALLGPNGAGKTTLLKCMLGLLRYEGAIHIGGLDARSFGKEARRLIGYLPQAPAFPAHLSAGDALEYYADLRGLRGEDIDARIAMVGLTPHIDKRVSELSGGQRQRLGLAVALLGDPPLLLLDEPVANLDPEGRRIFADLMAEMRGQGRTVLLSTHVFDGLERIASRALVLVDGKVAYDGGLEDLATRRPASGDGTPLETVLPLAAPAPLGAAGRAVAEALETLREEVVA